MRAGTIRKSVQKVVTKRGVQIMLPPFYYKTYTTYATENNFVNNRPI